MGRVGRHLLSSVFLRMRLPRLLRVVTGMVGVSTCSMRMVRRLLVLPALMMLCCFVMMASSMGMMLRRLLVVLGGFLRHRYTLVVLCWLTISQRACQSGSSKMPP